MNRVTVKVQTNRAEKAIREAHPRLVKRTVPMGGGWWHITLECRADGPTALAKLKERFGWARFSQWVHTQPVNAPTITRGTLHPLDALRALHRAVILCESTGVKVCSVLANSGHSLAVTVSGVNPLTLWDGTDHGDQEFLTPSAVELAILEMEKVTP